MEPAMRVIIGINDRVVCATPLGFDLDVRLEELDRFAKEVCPPSAGQDRRSGGVAQRANGRRSRRYPRCKV